MYVSKRRLKSLNVPDTFIEKKKDSDKEFWENSVRGYCCGWVGRYTAIVCVLVLGCSSFGFLMASTIRKDVS